MLGQQIGLGLFTPLCVHGFLKRIGPVAGCGLTTRWVVSGERLDYIASSWDLVNERAYWASGEVMRYYNMMKERLVDLKP